MEAWSIVQTCIVHLVHNSFRYASRRDWPELARDLRPVYTAPSAQAALDRFAEFSDKWEHHYPAIVRPRQRLAFHAPTAHLTSQHGAARHQGRSK